ncbi:MAG: CvpA family protein [Alphaproteobacteria bacterium]
MDILNNVNWLDVIIFVILLMSMWVGLVRGFMHELVSSLHWVIAAIGVYYLSAPIVEAITPALQPYLNAVPMLNADQKLIAFRLVFVVLFFVFLLLCSHIVLGMFSRPIHNKIFGPANRALGAILGLLKGLTILGFVWYFIRGLNVAELTAMKANSALLTPVNITADIMGPFIQNALSWVVEKGSDLFQNLSDVS